MLNTATSQNGFGNNRDIDVRLEMEPALRLGLGPGMTDTFLIFSFLITHRPGFFLTSAAEKTKTQGQNSSKKLKEKTQPLGSTLLKFVKLKKKTHLLDKFSG